MANPAVQKLKNFGIRHGEKVGVALVAALCLVFVVMAWSRETIDVTPDQIVKTANSAQSNLNREQTIDQIKEQLDQEGLTPQALVEQVLLAQEEQKSGETKLAFAGPSFTFLEPGAGLIRETPRLVAPQDLFATPGRGGMKVFKTNENGDLVFEEPKPEEPKKTAGRRSGPAGMGSSMSGGGYPGMGGGYPGMGGQPPGGRLSEEERKKQEEEQRRRIQQSLAGTPKGEVVEEIDKKAQEGLLPAQTTAGYRWVSIVGKLDHQAILDSYASALKVSEANPHYLRLDVERRELTGQNAEEEIWSDWQAVEREINETILAYVTQSDEELAPSDVRLEGLVDLLPFLQVGAYKGVHYGPLVPSEKVAPKTPPPGMGMAGRGGYGSMSGGPGMMSSGGYPGMDSEGMMSGGGYPGMESSGGGMMMSGGGGGMMGMMGMGGMGAAEANFPKSKASELMIRSLDFTVTPDTAYQYRLRVVVANPNLGLDNVKPGTDTSAEELYGPWSAATDPVRVPADVTTYAVGPAPTDPSAIRFQVVSFDEKTGNTVVANFDRKPGQLIGEPQSARIPKEDGKGTTPSNINFASKQFLVDAAGGNRPLDLIGRQGTSYLAPVLATVLRSDGVLVLRDETHDAHDPEMNEMQRVYRQILRDAEEGGRKPPPGGMMGGYGGMMSGGMGEGY